jgi:hypothetical protein
MRITTIILGALLTFYLASSPAIAKRWDSEESDSGPRKNSNGRKFGGVEEPATDTSSYTTTANTTTLSWSIPTTRENGEPLGPQDLAGYEIYYTSEVSGVSAIIAINDPYVTTHAIEGLDSDTYHFAISAYDTKGLQSALSEIVSTTVP